MKTMLKQVPFIRKVAKALRSTRNARSDLLEMLDQEGVGAEIGVHLGDFSDRILSVAKPQRLFLIDPWKYESSDDYNDSWYGGASVNDGELEERYQSLINRFASHIRSGKIVVVRKDSQSALNEIKDESLDYIYIDGNHLYEFVRKDLELSLRKVKPGGYISGDDYIPGEWWKGGVKKAVDEFGWNNDVALIWIKGGQFVFQKLGLYNA